MGKRQQRAAQVFLNRFVFLTSKSQVAFINRLPMKILQSLKYYYVLFLVLRWPRRKPVITFVRDFLRQKVQFAVRIYNIAFRSRFPIIGMFSIVDFLD